MPTPWSERRRVLERAAREAPRGVRWALTLAWMGVIFLLSAQPHLPQAPEPWLDTLLKKTAHALEYAILAALARWALQAEPVRRPGLLGWLLAVLYAITDEVHQSVVPGRHPSGWDVLIDSAGAWLGAGGWPMRHALRGREAARWEEPVSSIRGDP
jgi:VanZ family protein